MAFVFELGRLLGENIGRIVAESVDNSIALLDNLDLDNGGLEYGDSVVEECVHEIRKNCKKTRAVLRFTADGIDGRANATAHAMRDVARALSDLREAHILLPTFENLVSEYVSASDATADPGIGSALRSVLEAEAQRHGRSPAVLEKVHRILRDERSLLGSQWESDLSLGDPGGVLIRDQARAVLAANEAVEGAPEDRFHDWRKRAKTHWYHLRLVEPVLTIDENAYRERVYDMTELLGRERDLYTLSIALQNRLCDHSESALWRERISDTRRGLRVQARDLARVVETTNIGPVASRLRDLL
jgi:CHAD domain-containing protein